MSASTCLPTSFSTFRNKKKQMQNIAAKKLLNRFSYRYRLARSFSSLVAPDVGKTLKGYNAIVKIFLTNTAFEVVIRAALILKVSGTKSLEWTTLTRPELAQRIRTNKKLAKFILANSTDTGLQERISYMLEGRTNDILPVCYALRNVFAHGELTPSAIGLTNNKQYALLGDIANAILDYCDQRFTECMSYL